MTSHTTTTQRPARTRRDPDRGSVSEGVQRQDGTLPLYLCNTCGRRVVWATSRRTGRKYLVNVSTGAGGSDFYAKADLHDCTGFCGRKGR